MFVKIMYIICIENRAPNFSVDTHMHRMLFCCSNIHVKKTHGNNNLIKDLFFVNVFYYSTVKHDSDNITEAITLKTGNNVKFLFSQFHLKSKLYNVIL